LNENAIGPGDLCEWVIDRREPNRGPRLVQIRQARTPKDRVAERVERAITKPTEGALRWHEAERGWRPTRHREKRRHRNKRRKRGSRRFRTDERAEQHGVGSNDVEALAIEELS
jgi:hypothetical protein